MNATIEERELIKFCREVCGSRYLDLNAFKVHWTSQKHKSAWEGRPSNGPGSKHVSSAPGSTAPSLKDVVHQSSLDHSRPQSSSAALTGGNNISPVTNDTPPRSEAFSSNPYRAAFTPPSRPPSSTFSSPQHRQDTAKEVDRRDDQQDRRTLSPDRASSRNLSPLPNQSDLFSTSSYNKDYGAPKRQRKDDSSSRQDELERPDRRRRTLGNSPTRSPPRTASSRPRSPERRRSRSPPSRRSSSPARNRSRDRSRDTRRESDRDRAPIDRSSREDNDRSRRDSDRDSRRDEVRDRHSPERRRERSRSRTRDTGKDRNYESRPGESSNAARKAEDDVRARRNDQYERPAQKESFKKPDTPVSRAGNTGNRNHQNDRQLPNQSPGSQKFKPQPPGPSPKGKPNGPPPKKLGKKAAKKAAAAAKRAEWAKNTFSKPRSPAMTRDISSSSPVTLSSPARIVQITSKAENPILDYLSRTGPSLPDANSHQVIPSASMTITTPGLSQTSGVTNTVPTPVESVQPRPEYHILPNSHNETSTVKQGEQGATTSGEQVDTSADLLVTLISQRSTVSALPSTPKKPESAQQGNSSTFSHSHEIGTAHTVVQGNHLRQDSLGAVQEHLRRLEKEIAIARANVSSASPSFTPSVLGSGTMSPVLNDNLTLSGQTVLNVSSRENDTLEPRELEQSPKLESPTIGTSQAVDFPVEPADVKMADSSPRPTHENHAYNGDHQPRSVSAPSTQVLPTVQHQVNAPRVFCSNRRESLSFSSLLSDRTLANGPGSTGASQSPRSTTLQTETPSYYPFGSATEAILYNWYQTMGRSLDRQALESLVRVFSHPSFKKEELVSVNANKIYDGVHSLSRLNLFSSSSDQDEISRE